MSLVAVCSLYLPKSCNLINVFACYKQKCKLAPFNLAHPVCVYLSIVNEIVNNMLQQYIKDGCQKGHMRTTAGHPLLLPRDAYA